jgi:hypothetical protein
VGKKLQMGIALGTFEVGGKLRNAHKYQNAVSPVWDPNGTFLMSDFLSGFKANDYYGGAYNYGPVTSYGKLKTFFDNNPSRSLLPRPLVNREGNMVGAKGFEPSTSWSRTRRASQAALRPDRVLRG